ncbi:hypothetical protein Y032_0009g463 [Ancylostoma ceylanicum]|nr:hypothetical protein Y032_0009g463 [Ancylostoma ceylanicum]
MFLESFGDTANDEHGNSLKSVTPPEVSPEGEWRRNSPLRSAFIAYMSRIDGPLIRCRKITLSFERWMESKRGMYWPDEGVKHRKLANKDRKQESTKLTKRIIIPFEEFKLT